LVTEGAGAPEMPDVPLFDRTRALRSYKLNKMAQSLRNAENRARFKADEASYMHAAGLDEGEISAVLRRDWRELVGRGGNIFFLLKITASDERPLPLTVICAHQISMPHEEFLRVRLGKI
jgi:protocatechuate 4,5-dioxygenase alpha chain